MLKNNYLSLCFALVGACLASPSIASSTFYLTVPLAPAKNTEIPDYISISLIGSALQDGKTRNAYRDSIANYLTLKAKPAADRQLLKFSVIDGALPAGLQLDANSGEITGTPTRYSPAPSVFSVQAEYQDQLDSAQYSIKVDGHTYLSKQLRYGDNTGCALSMENLLHCWGNNLYGQLGVSHFENTSAATRVEAIDEPIKDFMTGWYHNCVITLDDKVKCWGRNAYGQVGQPVNVETPNYTQAQEVTGLRTTAKQLSAGNAHGCALLVDNTVQCWGRNNLGQLGNGSFTDSHQPVDVVGLTNVRELAVGENQSCAIRNDTSLWCWGNNSQGQLGYPSTTYVRRATAQVVPGFESGVASADSGWTTTCVVTTSGAAMCVGDGRYGNLGNGTQASSFVPTQVYGLNGGVSRIQLGLQHGCAVKTSGEIFCWGNNVEGQVGQPEIGTVYTTPQQVLGIDTNVKNLILGWRSSCVELDSYEILCWGRNDSGQLGDGTFINSASPRPLFAN